MILKLEGLICIYLEVQTQTIQGLAAVVVSFDKLQPSLYLSKMIQLQNSIPESVDSRELHSCSFVLSGSISRLICKSELPGGYSG